MRNAECAALSRLSAFLRFALLMSKPKILIQLDGDSQASVFDSVVAADAGVDHLFRHGGVAPEQVQGLVHGAMFTRSPDELHNTAVFVGGSDVASGEALLAAVKQCFFGPVRVSVMLDANGANTTAAAAVLAVGKHVTLAESTVLVLAATGPVGGRVVRMLVGEGAQVRAASRSQQQAQNVCDRVRGQHQGARVTAHASGDAREVAAALDGVDVVIAAGAAGAQLLSAAERTDAKSLKVAVDLNAVPPAGLEGVEVTDRATDRDGVICYGAIGVGAAKMKIHKEALRRLFTSNDQVLDWAEIYQIGQSLKDS